ncbi:MAG: MBL fold metallo-hydrolase [Clostridia bacterium]|nr:MBL fold metallo-hydrolase [Clostridia bacterium]
MKMHIFGTCAGTEPMPGRHHTSWAVEASDGGLYIFDAGGGCAHTAHNMGLDLTKMRAIFISHMHCDHLWGLPDLLWTPTKVKWYKKLTDELSVELFVPDIEKWNSMKNTLDTIEKELFDKITVNAHEVSDGVVFDDGYLKVEALHNRHLGSAEPWRSYSYRIVCENKTVIFTGDIKESADIAEFLADGCDMLLCETGHHKPDAMPKYLCENGYKVGYLAYLHHGRDILYDPVGSDKLIRDAWCGNYRLCNDGDTIIL